MDSWWNGGQRRIQLRFDDGLGWEVHLRQGTGAGIRPWTKKFASEQAARAYVAEVIARTADQWRQNPPGFIQ